MSQSKPAANPMSYDSITDWDYLWSLGVEAVKELETERGILASAKTELFGCIFGRDSLITSLELLHVYQTTGQQEFLNIVRKVLITMADLQGKELNIESGEEPGKVIHEYRTEGYERLVKPDGANGLEKPWYVYPDNILRNYDTVDATPLFLIAVYRYRQVVRQQTGQDDPEFDSLLLPSVKAAINWIFWYGDSNNDGFIDYQLKAERNFGGLVNQNWMDSGEATFHETGEDVPYPIAPVEAQAYVFLALKLWGAYFKKTRGRDVAEDRDASRLLLRRADELKQNFNQRFVFRSGDSVLVGSAIDGQGRLLKSVRSSMGHCLWASLNQQEDGQTECILDQQYIDPVVKRLLAPDMFVPEAGIRTLSSKSSQYNPNSYHNGSIWPHDNSMIAQGLANFNYTDEAWLIRIAVLKAVTFFENPVELYIYDQGLDDWRAPWGQTGNRVQAWSAAAILSSVASQMGDKGNQ